MELTRIGDLAAFDEIRSRWDDLRRADRYATVFLSSAWLRAFFATSPVPWSVLVLRDGDRLVAALPISIRGTPHPRLPVARELMFAADPFADYNGLLCRDEDEAEALAALARALRAMSWNTAEFRDAADPRIASLLTLVCADGAVLHEAEPTSCSVIELPETWDAYLASLSKATRRSTLRLLRALGDDLPHGRISSATPADAAEHISALLEVNARRWGTTAVRTERFRRLFHAAFAEGCLRVTILWDGDRPFAGGAAFVDPERRVYGAYMVGHSAEYGRFSPGKGILASTVQDAIAEGYATFDFMRGGESYKSSYATMERQNRHFSLVRPGVRTVALRLLSPAFAAIRSASARVRRRYGTG